MPEFHTGEYNHVRFAVLAAGSTARPADAAFFTLPNVSTSDAPISASATTKKYYQSGGGTFTKAGTATVTFTVSGDLPQDPALRAAVYRLRKAILAGENIYIERALDESPASTDWEGGQATITSANLPSPADNATTYSFKFQSTPAIEQENFSVAHIQLRKNPRR